MQQTSVDVAIGIVAQKGKVLICRRKKNARLGGYWEFPGGKCEPGESPIDCVCRELLEETGLIVRPVRPFAPIEYDYETGRVRLHPFLCQCLEGHPAPLESDAVRWVNAASLRDYAFPPANDPLIQELIELISATPDLLD